jgi:antagonist of KipI
MGATIEIVRPGLLSTVQDLGRPGRLGMALSQGGALDTSAMRLANTLVGNRASDAVLEITAVGPAIRFPQATAVAWTGADFGFEVHHKGQTTPHRASHRPVVVPAGSLVQWTPPTRGFRAWLACAGGIQPPDVLGSRSSHLAAGLGPARLKGGETLPLGAAAEAQTEAMRRTLSSGTGKATQGTPGLNANLSESLYVPRWSIPLQLPSDPRVLTLACFPGRHYDLLSPAQKLQLWQSAYGVHPQSSRQGLRLEAPSIADYRAPTIASEPVRFGTVQLPPEGVPYILLAEHQTTGGYPRVLEVCSSMAPILAQAGPGTRLQFVPTTLEEARARHLSAQSTHNRLERAIAAKLAL